MRALILAPFVLAFSLQANDTNSKDISQDVYCLYTQAHWIDFTSRCHSSKYTPDDANEESKIFYVKDTHTFSQGTVWNTQVFTATYSNGTLVLGNDKKESGTGTIRFGQGGWQGHIEANFNVKEAFLTGNLIAGNEVQPSATGGGATININASNSIEAKDFTLTFVMNSTNSHANFKADSISMENAKFHLQAGGHTLKFESNKDIDIKGSGSYMNLYAGTAGFGGATATFKGQNLNFAGTIVLGRESGDDAWLDSALNGAKIYVEDIKGKASFDTIKSRKGHIIANSNMSIDTLEILQSAQGIPGHDISPESRLFLKDNGTYTIKNLTLHDDQASSRAWLYVYGGTGSSLTSENITLGVNAAFHGGAITHTKVDTITLGSNSVARFHHLTLTPGGQITMDATNAQIVLDNQLVNGKNEAGVLELGVSMKDYANNVNGYGKPLLAITNAGDRFQHLNIQAGEVKRLIDAGEIKYNFVDSTGKQQLIHCDGSAKEQCAQIEKLIAIYEKEKPADNGNYTQGRIDLSAMGLKYEKVLTYNYIGLKVSSNNANNPYDIGDIRYYLYQKCGQSCIDEIGAVSNSMDKILVSQTQTGSDTKGEAQTLYVYEYQKDGNPEKVFCSSHDTAQCAKDNNLDSNTQLTQSSVTHTESDVFDWFNYLAITHHGITWTGANILLYGEDFFLQSANQLNNTLDQLSSVDRKSSASASTRLAADIARANRLVKLSNHTIDTSNQAFARLIARTPHYADSGTIASDTSHKINPAFLYKFSNRHEFMNNIWATAIGSASFVKNGHGTLYGINTGYDRFIPVGESGVIIGAQVSYGYGTYTADLLKNNSHNVNTGIYTRTFIQNHEVDLTANYTIGINAEDIYTRQNVWLSALDQSYGYNTHTAMIHANYGYVFGTNNKSLVFKPMGGLSYYHISVGEINGLKTALESNAAIQAPQTSRDLLALNLALEMRQYFSGASYYFINVGAQKDLYISKGTIENVRFAGDNSLSYRANDGLNTHVLATAGGEVLLGKQTFINFALGGKAGLSYKDLNLTANLGVRYVF